MARGSGGRSWTRASCRRATDAAGAPARGGTGSALAGLATAAALVFAGRRGASGRCSLLSGALCLTCLLLLALLLLGNLPSLLLLLAPGCLLLLGDLPRLHLLLALGRLPFGPSPLMLLPRRALLPLG
jgi:hypothetical protein